ncbi:ArnT family glycosyltransferase [Pedobacter metabolipauper]|uniref:Dolichyl-phosphate-mannose-protein mannosyltransferase n=1 Tax=Pedobacter metabolipauper TaxID=425513 RepID=A0A4R6ST84_9SPHI|nr:glycosyltransferase family 39 protein [Pedobacter metabolipauper]TDQ07085.1 dolichyl-phosphate-mannose-protein mannosyltransferase [Pedobacter metabolipauper]
MIQQQQSSERILFIFLSIWTLLNIIQACFVELHADEAYYWMYSRFLDWGYFDHPPMVALFIKIGDALFPSALGLRLLTIISSTLSIYLLWKIVSRYAQNILLFILLFSCIVLFHVYGFITTPDSPLFFFMVLFFYIYQRYEQEDKLKWAILLALVIACLLYSKYHAILVLLVTILANLKLLKRPSFWLIVGVAIVAYIPHILWQVKNDYPSFHYHIIDRSSDLYQFNFTYEYLLAQLALAGPLIGWFLYRSAIQLKSSDVFLRVMKFNFYGIFIFFLFSTLKGRVEAHWTLPAMLCLFILAYIGIARRFQDTAAQNVPGQRTLPAWFVRLAAANVVLIVLVRLILIFPFPGLADLGIVKNYFGTKEWAHQIQQKAGDAPVIFLNSFQVPSRYNYYNRTTKGFGYNSRYYRKNQYDIWPLEDGFRNKKVYYALQHSHPEDGNGLEDTISTSKGLFYGTWIQHVRMYQKVSIAPLAIPLRFKKAELITLKLKITNPYYEQISLGNAGQEWKCFLEYGYKKDGLLGDFNLVDADTEHVVIPAGQSILLNCRIKTPDAAGKFKLIFSLRTEPFSGSRNSGMIAVEVVP